MRNVRGQHFPIQKVRGRLLSHTSVVFSTMARKKSPQTWLVAVAVLTAVAVLYSVYNTYLKPATKPQDINSKKYTNKSVALTLSHSVLNSQLPLNDILLNSDNVTFILPPNLSLDDLACNISDDNEELATKLPRTLLKNYKLLNCKNIQGYFNLLKNLKPDTLLVCSDDLGITSAVPRDIHRFVKEIINVDPNKEDIYLKVYPYFVK